MVDEHIARLAKAMGTAFLNCKDERIPRFCSVMMPDDIVLMMEYFDDPPQVEVKVYWGERLQGKPALLVLTRDEDR